MITFDYFSLSLYFLVSTTMPFLPTAFSVILKPIVQTLFWGIESFSFITFPYFTEGKKFSKTAFLIVRIGRLKEKQCSLLQGCLFSRNLDNLILWNWFFYVLHSILLEYAAFPVSRAKTYKAAAPPSFSNIWINNPGVSGGVCCSHKAAALGFHTLMLRRGMWAFPLRRPPSL